MASIATEKVTLKVSDETSMDAYVARPAGGGKFPGLLVLQEAFGVNAHIRDVTERFGGEGYVAIAPELFHRTGQGVDIPYNNFPAVMPHLQALTPQGQSDDMKAAYEWLRSQPQVTPERVASIGFCMGGRASFLASAMLPLQAAISFYGGGIAQGLLDRVPDVHTPLLLIWGGLDQHITREMTRSVEDALAKEKKRTVNVTISWADHGFFCNVRPSYNAEAAALAWKLSLQFLDTHVKAPA